MSQKFQWGNKGKDLIYKVMERFSLSQRKKKNNLIKERIMTGVVPFV